MCGRARCSLEREDVLRAAGVPADRWRDFEKYLPKYNLGPGSRTPIIRRGEEVTDHAVTQCALRHTGAPAPSVSTTSHEGGSS
jgi:putative SOS response-associated peptidase YedK